MPPDRPNLANETIIREVLGAAGGLRAMIQIVSHRRLAATRGTHIQYRDCQGAARLKPQPPAQTSKKEPR